MSHLRSALPAAVLVAACAGLGLTACQESSREETPRAMTSSAAAATPPAPVRPETRKFRDWLAVCDNGNACAAFGPAAEGQAGWVRISLNPGPAAQPEIMAGFWGDQDTAADGPFTLTVDGRAFATSPTAEGDDTQAYAGMIRDKARPIVDALASGRRLTLSKGEQHVSASLSGAAAALLWIDERQGRLGTTAALVRRGKKPAVSVAAPPTLPVITPASAVAQTGLPRTVLPAAFEARPDVQQCRADTAFSPTFQTQITVDRLSPDRELWGVPCFAGAYNFSLRYFVTGPNGADPQPIAFPTSREPTDEVVNGEYDPASRTLTGFDKGRGVGDCGIASTWVWAGRDFVLQSESEMRECWGVPADLWPTTWRSR